METAAPRRPPLRAAGERAPGAPSAAGAGGPALDDAVRVAAIWVVVGGFVALVAWATGVRLSPLRILAPYLTWPLMTPLIVLAVRRIPLEGVRGLFAHLLLVLAFVPAHGLVFRLFMVALGRGFPRWPLNAPELAVTFTTELAFYFSTAWPIAAAVRLRRAREADVARAHAEAEAAGAELATALAQIGPQQLDALLGRVRLAIEDIRRDGAAAVAALAAYLRAVMAAAEPAPWTLESELGVAESYLAFERACSGRPLELMVQPAAATRAPVRQYALVSAVMSMLAEVPGPLDLWVEPSGGPGGLGDPDGRATAVRGVDPRTQATVARAEVRP
jgi:hypothetical protein